MPLLAALLLMASNPKSADLPLTNFKSGEYTGWKMTGDAFKYGPASGETLKLYQIENARGEVITSELDGDVPQGKLISPTFKVDRKYIAFRIGGGDYEYSTCINLLVGKKIVRTATGRSSDRLSPQSWDVSEFRGKSARIEVVDLAIGDWGHVNVEGLVQTDTPEAPPLNVGDLYQEKHRPQFHFTARQWAMARLNPGMRQEGWINDLNGLIYYDGEYHLFAQRWAKCWLHAVSKDLVHWEELPPAFWEENEGSGVQSGTCVIDYANTSGLSPDKKNPPMVAFWSRFDNKSQCVSYSLDKGRTWRAYSKNPTFRKAERDPKVFWYEPGKHWVMIMYGDGKYHILTSTNLLSWKDEGNPIDDSFECPDFFQLPLDGDPGKMKWVLVQGNGNYSIGSFNGTKFTQEGSRYTCDLGPNFYATQSWHNTETGDGRRIQTAWMRGSDFPDMPFNQQVSFPCELSLRTTPDGPRLYRYPIREIGQLLDKQMLWRDVDLTDGSKLDLVGSGDCYRLIADVEIADGATLEVSIRGESVSLGAKSLKSGDATGSVHDRVRHIEILIDRASIETFVNGGELSSTRFFLPKSEGLSVASTGGAVKITNLKLFPVKSVWSPAK